MKEIINWKDYDLEELENEKNYLIAFIGANDGRLYTGIYYYKDNKWCDEENLEFIDYLSKNGVIQWVSEIPKCSESKELIKERHHINGDYIITDLISWNNKLTYWISKIGNTDSYYCWTHISNEDDKKQLENFDSYIEMYKLKHNK